MLAHDSSDVGVGQIVAADHEERIVVALAEERFHTLHAPGVAAKGFLTRKMNRDSVARSVADRIHDALSQILNVYHNLSNAMLTQKVDQVPHDGLADDGNKRLGERTRQRVEAGAYASP